MGPAWDKLMKVYKGHASALVADVDCTAAGKPLCDSNGVRGFPTIKYGDPSALEDYKGGRDFDALKKFADENLKPMCSPTNIDLCDDDKKAEIAKLQEMSDDDLRAHRNNARPAHAGASLTSTAHARVASSINA